MSGRFENTHFSAFMNSWIFDPATTSKPSKENLTVFFAANSHELNGESYLDILKRLENAAHEAGVSPADDIADMTVSWYENEDSVAVRYFAFGDAAGDGVICLSRHKIVDTKVEWQNCQSVLPCSGQAELCSEDFINDYDCFIYDSRTYSEVIYKGLYGMKDIWKLTTYRHYANDRG